LKRIYPLREPPCDTLLQEELVSNDLPLNELSSDDAVQCESFPRHRLKPLWLTILHPWHIHLTQRKIHLPVVSKYRSKESIHIKQIHISL
jgi:hypothetical protein